MENLDIKIENSNYEKSQKDELTKIILSADSNTKIRELTSKMGKTFLGQDSFLDISGVVPEMMMKKKGRLLDLHIHLNLFLMIWIFGLGSTYLFLMGNGILRGLLGMIIYGVLAICFYQYYLEDDDMEKQVGEFIEDFDKPSENKANFGSNKLFDDSIGKREFDRHRAHLANLRKSSYNDHLRRSRSK